MVVVVLHPVGFTARHEVPAIEVDADRSRPLRARYLVEVRQDPQDAQPAVVLDEGHGIGVRGDQHLLVRCRSVVLARQETDRGSRRHGLEPRDQRQCRRPARLRVRQHFRAVHAIEREGGAVDIARGGPCVPVCRIDASLRQSERGSGRQVVNDDYPGSFRFKTDLREPSHLTPDPAGMKGVRHAVGRRREQRVPFPGRTPLVVRQRGSAEEIVGVPAARVLRRFKDEDLSCDLSLGRWGPRIVKDHRRGDPVRRRQTGCHAVRGDDRHRRAIGHELFHGDAGAVDVSPPIRPVVNDVPVVGDVHGHDVHQAERLRFRDEKIVESLPANAARVGRASLGLERRPPPSQIGGHQELRIDARKRMGAACALGPQRDSGKGGAGRNAGCSLQEVTP